MPDVIDVQPDNTVDAPNPHEFDDYVAKRQAERSAEPSEDVDDTPEEVPETTDSEPVTEPPAADAPKGDVTPEVVPESGTETETPEQKTEREKKRADLIPQSRLDEVTKARREAERERDAEKARTAELEAEVARLKAPKPEPKTDTPQPPAAETKPEGTVDLLTEPVMPDIPTLGQFEGDTDAWEAALKEFHKVEIPKFNRALFRFERQQEDIAARNKAAQEVQAKKDKETAEAAAAAKAEVDSEAASWTEQISVVKAEHPEFDDLVGKTPANMVVVVALQELVENGAQRTWWLATHHDEAQRIADLSKHIFDAQGNVKPGVTRKQIKQAEHITAIELGKIDLGAEKPPAKPAEPPKPEAPKPEVKADKPPETKPPVNQKPAVSQAPPPPSTVTESSTPAEDAKSVAASGDFDAYQRKRAPLVFKR